MTHCIFRRAAALLLCAALLLSFLPARAEGGGAVSGVVWEDENADGLRRDEKGLAKAKVKLEKLGGDGKNVSVASAVTGKDGAFSFTGLTDGEYRLAFELPSSNYFTVPGRDSAALPATKTKSATPAFTVRDGQTVEKNAGTVKAAANLSLLAFLDNDMNGKKVPSESTMANVQADVLYEQDGVTYVIASGLSDKQGVINFRSLSPAAYRVRVTLPRNFVVGPMGTAVSTQYSCFLVGENQTGLSDVLTLKPKANVGLGVGMVRGGALSGELWFDENRDGKRDANEPALTDAALTLRSDALAHPFTARPDAAGAYTFDALQPGSYQLGVELPGGMVFTYPGQSLITSVTAIGEADVQAEASQTTLLPPIGAMAAIPQQIVLSLYVDENMNGQWDDGEAPLPGAAASVSRDGKTLEKTTTDEQGAASFTVLRSDSMTVSAQLPEGYVFLPVEGGLFDTSMASATASGALNITHHDEPVRLSAPVIVSSAISGKLYSVQQSAADLPLNDLLAGVAVQAVNSQGRVVQSVRTNYDGAYRLSPLPAGEYAVRFLLHESCLGVTAAQEGDAGASRIVSASGNQADTEKITLTPGQTAEGADGGVRRESLAGKAPLAFTRVDKEHLLISADHRLINDAAAFPAGSVKGRIDGYNAALDPLAKKLGANRPKVYLYLVESSLTHQIDRTFPCDSPTYEYLKKHLHADGFDHLKYTTYEEFCNYFYTTDHHWNYVGSYRGYLDIVRMLLGEDEKTLAPTEAVELPIIFNGSFAKLTQNPISQERFTLYRFSPFPRYTANVAGRKKAYDHLQEYLNHKYASDLYTNHYGFSYGGDVGLLILDSREVRNGRTLLILGNSLSNAVKTLLTAHYEKIVYVDLRHYKKACEKDFSLRETVLAYQADQILIIGDMSLFLEGDKPMP